MPVERTPPPSPDSEQPVGAAQPVPSPPLDNDGNKDDNTGWTTQKPKGRKFENDIDQLKADLAATSTTIV